MRVSEILLEARLIHHPRSYGEASHGDFPTGGLLRWIEKFGATPDQLSQAVDEVLKSPEHAEILKFGYRFKRIPDSHTLDYRTAKEEDPDVIKILANGKIQGHAWRTGVHKDYTDKGRRRWKKQEVARRPSAYPISSPPPHLVEGDPVESIKRTMINSMRKVISVLKDRALEHGIASDETIDRVRRQLEHRVMMLSNIPTKAVATHAGITFYNKHYEKKVMDLHKLHSRASDLIKKPEPKPSKYLPFGRAVEVAVDEGLRDGWIPPGMIKEAWKQGQKTVVSKKNYYDEAKRDYRVRFSQPWVDQFRHKS